jgi:uncharacterized membrane protein (UPF0127 family)
MSRNSIIELKSETGESLRCRVARTFGSRFMGLMGRASPATQDGEGLLISPCNSIHMFFMKFSIDAIFLDRRFRIVKLVRNLAPGKLAGPFKDASQVVEVAAGRVPPSFREGVVLSVQNV